MGGAYQINLLRKKYPPDFLSKPGLFEVLTTTEETLHEML